MRKIIIFKDGSAGMVNKNSATTVRINGELPIEEVEVTEEKIKEYFPDLVDHEIEIKP